MNAEQLLEHYERVAEAPDAVMRLRGFVLDIAVRGKLVPQSDNEESAGALLQRIASEKARRVKAGELRQPKNLPPLDDQPCALPQSWRWSCLAEIGSISPRVEADDDTQASFVPMPMIASELGIAHQHEPRKWGEIKKGYTHFAEGDVGLAKITPCFENGKSTVFRNLTGGIGSGTTELHVVRPVLVSPEYVLLFFKSSHFIETGIPRMTGTAGQKRVPADYFAYSPFPLPPLAEQHRIVAKVDELMALCDQLEAARAQREATRDRLTAATFARLNTPDPAASPDGDASMASSFESNARFALNNLPAVAARPDQIKQLRQTILNLAVRGQLGTGHARDESASVLMESIRSGRSRIQSSQGIRVREIRSANAAAQGQYPLPETWVWARLGEVCHQITDGAHHTPAYQSSGVPFLSVKDVSSGRIRFDDTRFITEEAHKELTRRCNPARGDILLTKVGTTGIAVEIDTDRPFSIFVSLALLKFPTNLVSGRYLCHLINSPHVRAQSARDTQGIGNKNLVLKMIEQFIIPIPPLSEQHRIVAKVDELMSLCDQLEASLTTGDTTRRRLLDALLQVALATSPALSSTPHRSPRPSDKQKARAHAI